MVKTNKELKLHTDDTD